MLENILITGATGFVGMALCKKLSGNSRNLKTLSRAVSDSLPSEVLQIAIGDFCSTVFNGVEDLSVEGSVFDDIDVVIHTAARVHVMNDTVFDPLSEFRKANVDFTLNLALQAAAAKVKRFIFLSSIKVNGETTRPGEAFSAKDHACPAGPYAISKWEAEIGLRQLSKETDMEIVIIRSPLVYGPGVKGNFLSMIRWICRGVPLPLGAIQNKRSLVALDNLMNLIVTCIKHPAAANQVFLVSDGEDISTTELLRWVGKALGKPTRLIPVPARLLTFVASLLGKKAVAERLFGSLQVDISETQELLGWKPPISVDLGLRKAVENFK